MNLRRIRALRNFIAKLPPKAVDMMDWIQCDRENETVAEAAQHTCGTQACIAGWAILRFHDRRNARIKNHIGARAGMRVGGKEPELLAQELLGLNKEEAERLFLGEWSTMPKRKDLLGAWIDKTRWQLTKRDVLRELDYVLKNRKV